MNTHNAFKFISNLCKESYIQSWIVEKQMRRNLELTNNYQVKLWTRITLERLTKNSVGTNDIQHHATKQVKGMNNSNIVSKYQKVIRDNMKNKLTDAVENEAIAKDKMVKSNIELKKSVKITSLAGIEYSNIVDRMWNINWRYNKEACNNKLKWLQQKQDKELETIVQLKKENEEYVHSKKKTEGQKREHKMNVQNVRTSANNESKGLEIKVQNKDKYERNNINTKQKVELENIVQNCDKESRNNESAQNEKENLQ